MKWFCLVVWFVISTVVGFCVVEQLGWIAGLPIGVAAGYAFGISACHIEEVFDASSFDFEEA